MSRFYQGIYSSAGMEDSKVELRLSTMASGVLPTI